VKFLKRLFHWNRKREEKKLTVRQVEMKRIRRALRRHEADIEEMWRRWEDAGRICCPNCMFRGEYSDLLGRHERAAAILRNLEDKEARDG